MTDFEAIQSLHPTVVRMVNNVAYDSDGNEVTYDKTAVDSLVESKKYKYDRQDNYPSIGEQLDMQYWDAVNGTTTWKDAIAQVKADNPKPE